MADQYLISATIKLLINRERERVVLAEVGEDYEDLLFSALTFPVATLVSLARSQEDFEGCGCFSNLYRSVEGLSLQCFKTPACKRMLLHPRYVREEGCRRRKVKLDDAGVTKYFTCPDFCKRGSKALLSYYETVRCDCGKFMNKELYLQQREFKVEESTGNDGGYMYFVKDDSFLRILYHSYPTNLVKYLKDHGIKCMNHLEETAVTVGLEQVSCLLLNSFVSKTALTDTFLKKQGGVRMESLNQPLISSTMKSTGKATGLTVDVLVRKSDSRIMFAVADNEFIDLLFTFLTIPLINVCHMIHFPTLEDSERRQPLELPPYYSRHSLLPTLKAQPPPLHVCSHTRMPNGSLFSAIRALGVSTVVHDNEQVCIKIDPKSPTKESTDSKGGYVKDKAVFLVSDDLVVYHLASTSTISPVKDLGIPLSDLETGKICIGEKEAVQLLEASFRSSSALTIAFGSLLQVPA